MVVFADEGFKKLDWFPSNLRLCMWFLFEVLSLSSTGQNRYVIKSWVVMRWAPCASKELSWYPFDEQRELWFEPHDLHQLAPKVSYLSPSWDFQNVGYPNNDQPPCDLPDENACEIRWVLRWVGASNNEGTQIDSITGGFIFQWW